MSILNQSRNKSLIHYIGTLGKKKRIKELEELETEAKYAIDGKIQSPAINNCPEDFILNELDERQMIHPSMKHDLDYLELKRTLINWINDELSEFRIIVCDLEEDLYDGQILGKLVEKLTNKKLDVVEVTLNEELQKLKIREVLSTVNNLLEENELRKWTVEGIHKKDVVQIIHLLIALIRKFDISIILPENVKVKIVVIQKLNGLLNQRIIEEVLTDNLNDLNRINTPKDNFDEIFDNSSDLLDNLTYHLILFLNENLTKLNIECQLNQYNDIDPKQFNDGLLLIFLMGLCANYFVPLGDIYMTPNNVTEKNIDQLSFKTINDLTYQYKLHNMNYAFQLMEEAGINIKKRVRPEDIINCDKKSLIKTLYLIYTKFTKTTLPNLNN